MENKQQIVPVQYIPMPQCEEDEIDLRELFKTIWKHKNLIAIFTIIITVLAGIYAFSKTPIYETKADIQVGYINNNNNNNNNNKIYLLEPHAVKIYVKNNFDNSTNDKITYPKVDIDILKRTNDILNLKIDNFSNKEGMDYLNKILKSIHEKEDKKLNIYIKNINSQINILKNYTKDLENQIITLKEKLKNVKNADIYKTILDNINQIQKEIVSSKLKIANLKNKISPINITRSHIIGKIEQHNHPIKPKKKLIVIVAFITSFILAIFLVFFIEFIKGFKEEENNA
jgi:uncharacterized protein involved in exopolysaccharide biosynthesis